MRYTNENMSQLVKQLFCFLETDFGFDRIKDEVDNSGVLFMYQNEFGKVVIDIDYRDMDLWVKIINGKQTPYPNDAEFGKKIKLLRDFVLKYEPGYNLVKLCPDKSKYQEYEPALRENAHVLNKHGHKFLYGDGWHNV